MTPHVYAIHIHMLLCNMQWRFDQTRLQSVDISNVISTQYIRTTYTVYVHCSSSCIVIHIFECTATVWRLSPICYCAVCTAYPSAIRQGIDFLLRDYNVNFHTSTGTTSIELTYFFLFILENYEIVSAK